MMVKSRLATKKAGSRQKSSFHRYLRAARFSAAHCGHFFFGEEAVSVVVDVVVVAAAAVSGVVVDPAAAAAVAASASAAFRARCALILRYAIIMTGCYCKVGA